MSMRATPTVISTEDVRSYAFKDVCLEGYSRTMEQMARRVAREVKAMTRREIITNRRTDQLGGSGRHNWGHAAAHAPDAAGDRAGRDVGGDGPARWTAAAQADRGADHPRDVPA